jgi:hypothetical protein
MGGNNEFTSSLKMRGSDKKRPSAFNFNNQNLNM